MADTDRPTVLDLAVHHVDVQRISRSLHVFAACLRAGWEKEDLEQEILLRLLSRQEGRSRYDPTRGTLGQYLCQATKGILLNCLEHAKAKRLPGYGWETSAIPAYGATVDTRESGNYQNWTPIDPAQVAVDESAEVDFDARRLERDLVDVVAREVAEHLGTEGGTLARLLLTGDVELDAVPREVRHRTRDVLRRRAA